MRNFILIFSISILFFKGFAQDNKPKQPDLPGDLVFDFGLGYLYNAGELENKPFKSTNFGAYYMYTLKLNDFVTVNPQLGLTFERYDFFNSVNFTEGEDRIIQWDTIADVPLSQNKLITNFIELPLEIRFYPLKTIEGEGIFVGIGGSIGLNTNSFTRIRYEVDGDRRKSTLSGDFGLNNFRYGVQARIGMKGINAFYKVYLNDMFDEGPGGTNPAVMTFGINFTGF